MDTIISEEIPLNINIKELCSELMPELQKFPIVKRSAAIGGWTLQSTNGSYLDGWSLDFCPYNGPENLGPSWNPLSPSEGLLNSIQNFVGPTELMTPFIQNLLKQLEQLGLNPPKAIVLKLSAKISSIWDIDGSKKYYQVRLHIPLITNEQCFYENEAGKIHLPANGSAFLVKVNQIHRVHNDGDTDPYHVVVNVWDTLHKTKYFQYKLDESSGESVHP